MSGLGATKPMSGLVASTPMTGLGASTTISGLVALTTMSGLVASTPMSGLVASTTVTGKNQIKGRNLKKKQAESSLHPPRYLENKFGPIVPQDLALSLTVPKFGTISKTVQSEHLPPSWVVNNLESVGDSVKNT